MINYFLQILFEPIIDLLWGGSVGTVVSEIAVVVGKSVHSWVNGLFATLSTANPPPKIKCNEISIRFKSILQSILQSINQYYIFAKFSTADPPPKIKVNEIVRFIFKMIIACFNNHFSIVPKILKFKSLQRKTCQQVKSGYQTFNPIPTGLGHVTLIYGLIPPMAGRNRVKEQKTAFDSLIFFPHNLTVHLIFHLAFLCFILNYNVFDSGPCTIFWSAKLDKVAIG